MSWKYIYSKKNRPYIIVFTTCPGLRYFPGCFIGQMEYLLHAVSTQPNSHFYDMRRFCLSLKMTPLDNSANLCQVDLSKIEFVRDVLFVNTTRFNYLYHRALETTQNATCHVPNKNMA